MSIRAARLAATTAWWALFLFAGLALLRKTSRRAAWRRRAFGGWSRALCRVMAVRREVVGEPPAEACLLVSNHLSYLDIPVLASLVPSIFVSKAEVADWPVIGFLSGAAGTLFVDRRRKRELPEVNARIRRALDAGDRVVLFPEGTSTRGATVTAFKPSLLEPAASLQLPVRFATLSYATLPGDPPASQAVCWWGDMTFGPHVLQLLRLRGIEARIVFGAGSVREPDRKLLAQRLHAEVAQSFTPVR